MDIRSLKDIAVVSIAHGEKLGTVDDVLIDPGKRRAVVMTVVDGGRLRKDRRYLPYESIKSVGGDAVMVEDGDALHDSFGDGSRQYHTLSSLTSLKVVADSGTYLGNVATAHLEPATGELTEFEVGRGGIGGLFSSNTIIDASSVTSIGDSIMVVPGALFGDDGAVHGDE